MQLVLVAHGGGTPLEIRHITVVVGHDECALKLSGIGGIDAEIGTEFHGAPCAFGDIDKGAVAEHSTVESSIEVVTIGHHTAEILLHEVGMLLYGITDGAEDDTLFGEFLLEGGLHRYRVHDGIYGHTAQRQALFQRNTEFVEGLHEFGVNLLLSLLVFLGHGVSIVGDGLIVYGGQVDVSPGGLLQCLPVAESLQPEFEHPLRLLLLLGNQPHHVLIESSLNHFGMHVGREAELIFLFSHLFHVSILLIRLVLVHLYFVCFLFVCHCCCPSYSGNGL